MICERIHGFITRILFPPGVTPLKLSLMGALYLALFGNSLTITLVFAYLPRMTKDFGYEEKDVEITEVGFMKRNRDGIMLLDQVNAYYASVALNLSRYYAGLIASSFYMGRSIGSYFWGWLSDKVGNRVALMLGQVLTTIMTLLFGFSSNFYWALITRCIQGLVNSIVIVSKATIAGISDDTNQGFAMSLTTSAVSTGLIIGPSFGGFLVLPAEKHPQVFSKDGLFGKFPYLFPNLLTAIILVLGIITTYFIIPETSNRASVSKDTSPLVSGEKTRSYVRKNETVANINGDNIKNQTETVSINKFTTEKPKSYVKTYQTWIDAESYLVCSMSYTPQSLYKRLPSHHEVEQTGNTYDCADFKNSNLGKLLRSKCVVIAVSLYGIYSLVAVGFDELFPLWSSTSESLGGLSFATEDIGTTILIVAIPLLIMGVFGVGRMMIRFGSRKPDALGKHLRISCPTVAVIFGISYTYTIVGRQTTYQIFLVANFVLIFLLPLFPSVGKANNRTYLWISLIPVFGIIRFSNVCCFLTVNIFLNNSVEPELLGSVNGLGMAMSSTFRSISPTLFGSIYSWSLRSEGEHGFPINHFFAFVCCGFFALLTLSLAVMLPADIENRKYTVEQEDDLATVSTSSVQGHRENRQTTI